MMVGGHSGRTRANAKGGVNGRAPVCIRASNERKQTVGKVDNASSVSTQSLSAQKYLNPALNHGVCRLSRRGRHDLPMDSSNALRVLLNCCSLTAVTVRQG